MNVNRFLSLVLFVCTLSTTVVKAQTVSTQNQYGRYGATRTLEGAYTGSLYLFDDWRYGTFKLADNKTERLKTRYNLLEDLFYIQDKEGNDVVYNKIYNEVILENDGGSLEFKRMTNESSDHAFFQVLFDDKVQLLKRNRATAVEVMGYNEASAKKKVVKQFKYYAQFKDRPITEIKPSKKNILDFMTNKKPEVEGFIKAQNIDFKNDGDLVKLFKYYNSLL